MKIEMSPIGYLRTQYNDGEDTPKQYIENLKDTGDIEIEEKYRDGMLGLNVGDYIVITFYLHKIEGYDLQHYPRGDKSKELKGIFATRSPRRPNKIGHSVCEIVAIEQATITIKGVDMLDGSPVVDIKAYDPKLYPQTKKDESQ